MSQRRMCPHLFTFVCFLFFVTVKSQDKDNIRQTIETAFANLKNNPALTVTVVKDGETVFAEGFGKKNKDSSEAVTNRTLFGIGYLTEPLVTSVLEMIFNDNSKYHFDKYLRKLSINTTSEKLFPSKLRSLYASSRDLAAHRMGFPKHTLLRLDDTINRSNVMSRYRHMGTVGRFRDSYYHSVHDYTMLCVVLEKMGNATFENLVRKKLLNPLNMASTKFWTTDNFTSADLATGYIDYYGTLYEVSTEFLKKLTSLGCADTIVTNGLDMGEWIKFVQAGGKTVDNVELISKSDFESLRKPWLRIQSSTIKIKVPSTPYTYSLDSCGAGWRRGYYRGHRISGQHGYIYGYTSHLTIFEDTKLGIFTSMSGEDEDRTFQVALHAYLSDIYLNNTQWLNSTFLGNRLADFIPPKTKTAPTFDRTLSIAANRYVSNYTGTYRNDLYGNVSIESNNGNLKLRYGFVEFDMFPKATEDEFYFESLAPALKVVNNGDLQFSFTGDSTTLLIPTFERKDVNSHTFEKVL